MGRPRLPEHIPTRAEIQDLRERLLAGPMNEDMRQIVALLDTMDAVFAEIQRDGGTVGRLRGILRASSLLLKSDPPKDVKP